MEHLTSSSSVDLDLAIQLVPSGVEVRVNQQGVPILIDQEEEMSHAIRLVPSDASGTQTRTLLVGTSPGAAFRRCEPSPFWPAVPPTCHKQRSPAVSSGQSRSL
jgi:hypothetical protein